MNSFANHDGATAHHFKPESWSERESLTRLVKQIPTPPWIQGR
jgi:hypothetical protein